MYYLGFIFHRMPLDNWQCSRRSVLGVTGLSLSGLAGGVGTAATLPENETSNSAGSDDPDSRPESSAARGMKPDQPIGVEDDRLVVTVDRSDWNGDERVSENGESVPYDVVVDGAADVSRAIETGYLTFERRGEQRVLVPTVTPETIAGGTDAV
jgi:hypothetical protein